MILVTAAGGRTGRAVVAALASAGHEVRALRRTGEAVEGATETVAGDAGDLSPHLDGVGAVYFIWPNFVPGEAEAMSRTITTCHDRGVQRIVHHSVLRPNLEAMPHHWAKMRAEERLFESGLAHVVLEPGAYMQNIDLHLAREQGVYPCAWGERVSQSLVDLADVAEVAARACVDERLLGGCYELVGPESLTAADVAAALSAAVGRPVNPVDVGSEGWARAAADAGLDEHAIDCGVRMAAHYRRHGVSGSAVGVVALLARPATTLTRHLDTVTG
ncbi:MAG: SDR family oxidoreductase [Acidimicrobiales bacterium]